MKIKLISLTIHNFKGLKDFDFDPEGENINVLGQNASGKTTIFDAFTWLLFGKSSDGSTKFNAKPLDGDGQEILGAEPLVEAALDVDGKSLTLRRELKESWVQPKGSIERVRKSDVTVLMVDSVPKKVGEYKDFISSLLPEDQFRLLTDPAAFNRLDWQKRRDILLTLVPGVSDEDVIASDKKLADLTSILDNQSVDDRKKAIKYQRTEIKKKIDGIPARIDEAERAKPELSSSSLDDLHEMQQTYKQTIADLQTQLQLVKTANTDIQRETQIQEVQFKIAKKRSAYQTANDLSLSGLRQDISKQEDLIFDYGSQYQDALHDSQRSDDSLANCTSTKDELLKQYHAEKALTFDEGVTVCPTCHQTLPAEQIEDLRKGFNQRKSEKLTKLIADGKAAAAKIIKLKEQVKANKAVEEKAETQLNQANDRLHELQREFENQKASVVPFEQTKDYTELAAEIAKLQAADQPKDDSQVVELQNKLQLIQTNLADVEAEISKYDQVKTQDERITQLQQDEADLKAQAQELDRQDFLIQHFVRAKVEKLEDQINSLFSIVKFKLFDVQKNGDLADTAEATVDGVPYSTDLNTGAKINAGLDILNVLSEHYGMIAPIFIDNAETVNEIMPTEAQQIRLVVTKDKKMKVEVHS
ncbi:AAA family ATPase [Lacticaseibacillus paracasei subsp. tolerans]|uniref:AAA family ATPase n=1 Tax=Lacticaseibacillus paracasei TaxID=1597 RepID=UPI0018AD31B8|nr:AAA family ATPase [Lacticaseibacillus paracasei]QPI89310.1 AAA family ATPase [Lacticaseibacillus paracasei subsp. tolerans]